LFENITLNFVTIWLHWYGSSKTVALLIKVSGQFISSLIRYAKSILLILVLYHCYVTIFIIKHRSKISV
jgi:hypothetical protein